MTTASFDGSKVRRLLEGKRLKRALMQQGDDFESLSSVSKHLLLYGTTSARADEADINNGDRFLNVFRDQTAHALQSAERRICGLERQHRASQRRMQTANLKVLLQSQRPALVLHGSQKIRLRIYGDPAAEVAEQRTAESEQKRKAAAEKRRREQEGGRGTKDVDFF